MLSCRSITSKYDVNMANQKVTARCKYLDENQKVNLLEFVPVVLRLCGQLPSDNLGMFDGGSYQGSPKCTIKFYHHGGFLKGSGFRLSCGSIRPRQTQFVTEK